MEIGASPAPRSSTFPPSSAATGPAAFGPEPLIGRERERSAVKDWLLHPDIRLVVLTGPPGVGKTRLALQVARDVAAAFDGPPVEVFLAAVRDPTHVMERISGACGVPEDHLPVPERLARRFGGRRLLLVLDNVEHVLPAAPEIAALVRACPGLRVLATSRQRLRVHGESLIEVPPLALPDLTAPAGPDAIPAIWATPAVALFAARAGANLPRTNEAAGIVAQICTRLDGLPLAIELAAAQAAGSAGSAGSLPDLPGLLDQMDRRLPLLVQDHATPTRSHHVGLRDAIAWSRDLLRPEQMVFFDRLSVFVGGFDLEAASALAAGWQPEDGYPNAGGQRFPFMAWETMYGKESPADVGDWDPPRLRRLDLDPVTALDDLVDRHLVRETSATGQRRYELLETVREFGLEWLALSGEEAATRHAHAALMLTAAEAAGTGLTQHDRRSWLRRIVADLGNIGEAFDWLGNVAATHPAANQLALRLVESLANLWQTTGRATTGRAWIDAALARPGGSIATRANALYATGLIAWIQGDDERAAVAFAEGVILARRCGYQVGIARCLFGQGLVAWRQGNFARMDECLRAAVVIYQDWEDPVIHGLCLVAQGIGALGLAVGAFGPPEPAALPAAMSLMDRAHALYAPVGFGWGVATARLYGAGIARLQGDRPRAVTFLREALRTYQAEEDPWGMGAALCDLAIYVAADGDVEEAVRLFGVVAALQERGGTILPPTERESQEAAIAAIRARLGEPAFAALFAAGREMDVAAAVATALAVPTSSPNGRKPAPNPALAPPVELTERQLDIVQRLADGETVQEIARARHVQPGGIYSQIATIRTQLAAKTTEHLVSLAIRRGLI